MIPATFEYYSPRSLREAIGLLSAKEDVKIIAGGQSLVPLMKLRLAKPKHLIDLGRIPGLNTIKEQGDSIFIGALTTHAELSSSELLRRRCPLLPQTASTIGDVQVRSQGTIGGSLAHADPAGDLPAAVLALGAEIKAVGPRGERWIRTEDFFFGLLMTALEPDEILTDIKVPVLERAKTAYLKAAQRTSGFAVVGVAACLKLDPAGGCEEIALGITGVTDKTYRPDDVESRLRGKKLETKLIEEAASGVCRNVDVVDDINGSKEYRTHLARVYTFRAIEAALRA
ncbi:MAG: xanthine dehydrogenase family protein subunit M [Deltaproteobacteria bacterium]|nr:xanthine dehydrogenase family protein subunit M [Deltaproteobacteria bacterium]